jgi:hypothetical protein
MLKATVSGSFHRHIAAIYEAVGELRSAGVDVLSPADPRVVDHLGEFLFVASDRLRSIKLVQQRHFEAIRRSDFLWVVCPDGYTGESTSGEIGAATVLDIPIFASHAPANLTWQQYIRVAPSISHAIELLAREKRRIRAVNDMLLDPIWSANAIARANADNEQILTGRVVISTDEAELRLRSNSNSIMSAVGSIAK